MFIEIEEADLQCPAQQFFWLKGSSGSRPLFMF